MDKQTASVALNSLMTYLSDIQSDEIGSKPLFQALVKIVGSAEKAEQVLSLADLKRQQLEVKNVGQLDLAREKLAGGLATIQAKTDSAIRIAQAKEGIRRAPEEEQARAKIEAAKQQVKIARHRIGPAISARNFPEADAYIASLKTHGADPGEAVRWQIKLDKAKEQQAKIAERAEAAKISRAEKRAAGYERKFRISPEAAMEAANAPTPYARKTMLRRLIPAARRGRMMKGGMIAGGLALGLPLVAKMIFGGKEEAAPQLNPEIQMMLAQQMAGRQGGGVDTSRTLRDMAKMLTIIKQLQDMAGVMPGGPQQMGRLI